MCVQVDKYWKGCGHAGYLRMDPCTLFPVSCLGPGPKHKREEQKDEYCPDCHMRAAIKRTGYDKNRPYTDNEKTQDKGKGKEKVIDKGKGKATE